MKILIVAATSMEVKLLADEFEFIEEKNHCLKSYRLNETEIDILVSGIGAAFTTFQLTGTLANHHYDRVLDLGISGSLTSDLKIGDVVNVVSDEFADLGIEKPDGFLTLFESGYINPNEFPFEQGTLKATLQTGLEHLQKVRGITSNQSHGRGSSIAEIKSKYSAQVESMEGAAVFYVCNNLGVPVSQVRAISNYVETRDFSKWNIPLALQNLKDTILTFVRQSAVTVS